MANTIAILQIAILQASQDSMAGVLMKSELGGAALQWFDAHPVMAALAGLVVLAVAAWLSLVVVRRVVLRFLALLARRSPTFWDEVALESRLFRRLAWIVPLLIIHQGILVVPNLPDDLTRLVQQLAVASFILVMVRACSALLTAVNEIYSRYPRAKDRPIKGYLQVVNIVAHLVAVILIIATLLDRSPIVLFSGLGAMTAILMLVFRDSILSLVAGVQLTANDLIRVGDWIEMPQFNADGDVIDIALNSVSVQNWDKTITVIPTHKFLEHSFKNWRGMFESGGRRIKRAIYIDMSTIRFLTEEEIEHFGRFALLRDYIAQKKKEIEEYNRAQQVEEGVIANARRLTNIGTLRAYIVQYLRQHPGIHQDMTLLVRQLSPTPEGLPLEIYAFTNDTRWVVYEGIQSDIFDHILAMVPQFGLRVFQKPAGQDVIKAVREMRLEPV
jgi:miniconductance mechanosensitive channel